MNDFEKDTFFLPWKINKFLKWFTDCFLSCGARETAGNDSSSGNMTCGDVNDHDPRSGVIMQSTCSLHKYQNSNECQTIRKLGLALEKELPVFDRTQNVIYRSIACARCSNAVNVTFWGLTLSYGSGNVSFSTPVNITAVKKFLKKHSESSWKYAPRNGKQHYKYCVLHDAPCAWNSNHLRVFSVVKDLCSSYCMVFVWDFPTLCQERR